MSSKRLPGKVLFKINDNLTILEKIITEVKKSKYVKKIIVAIPNLKSDDVIAKVIKNKAIIFRGPHKNVLKRIYLATKSHKENSIIQLTADNPLIDHKIIDYTVDYYFKNYPFYDFVSNNNFFQKKKKTFPIGTNVSVFKKNKLSIIYKIAKKEDLKEHPSLYFYREGKKLFNIKNINAPKKWISNKKLRLTIDTLQDFKFIKILVKNLGIKNLQTQKIIKFVNDNPYLLKVNMNIKQKMPKLY
tara:strand:- start:154 stop:885 length:732 start_codon:yes stop_codon:yes gene_type:complete